MMVSNSTKLFFLAEYPGSLPDLIRRSVNVFRQLIFRKPSLFTSKCTKHAIQIVIWVISSVNRVEITPSFVLAKVVSVEIKDMVALDDKWGLKSNRRVDDRDENDYKSGFA